MKLYVSIDDTDNKESFGTGRMARMLSEGMQEQGLIARASITRHQFLIHPDIPYTSHNSSACIEADGEAGDLESIFKFSAAFLASHHHTGSNPGLCVGQEKGIAPGARRIRPSCPEGGNRHRRGEGTFRSARHRPVVEGETGQGIIGADGEWACGARETTEGSSGCRESGR